jgi:hypothetical protein
MTSSKRIHVCFLFPLAQNSKRKLVASANEQSMSMMGNSSLHHAEIAMISVSIVDRAVFLCNNLDCQNTAGHSAKVIVNPVGSST